MNSLFWKKPPLDVFILEAPAVHVWCASLDLDSSFLAASLELLSPEEQIRARQFYFEKDQKQFVASRGILRNLLGRYLQEDPKNLKISYTPQGKPFLPDTSLFFNLSHSQNILLIALSRKNELGVDVESIREKVDHLKIAKRFFTQKELRFILKQPEDLQGQAFYEVWTSKEALLKAKGIGFFSEESRNKEEGFSVLKLPDPSPYHKAALALAELPQKIECYLFSSL